MFKMNIVRKENEKEMARAAEDLYAADCLRITGEGRDFSVALSGGSTPLGFFDLLAADYRIPASAWRKTHVFWVDERCVPEWDPASNYGNAKRVLLDHVPLDPDNIHRMPSQLPPEQGAFVYQKELLTFFASEPNGIPCFDLVVLGIGADGHVASIFPESEQQEKEGFLVVPARGGIPDVWRLTVTLPVLNAAEHVMILASGREKSKVVRALMGESGWRPPATKVRPSKGVLSLVMDRFAAGELGCRDFEKL